jgi:hypothetical protein
MTWPSGAGVNTNQWGPWQPVPASGPPPAAENVAQSTPSPATWNANAGKTSTQYFLDVVLNVDGPQQGVIAISNVASIAKSYAGQDPATVAVNKFS